MTSAGSWRLNAYAWLVVAATFFLIFVGAMVTSKDAGLSVPDWPLSYGSINPPGWWHVENVFWEHGHRLVGAAIGLLTIGLTIALWRAYPRHWIRWLGIAALVAVCLQGLMGGLRVTQMSVVLAIIHGCFGQAFFALLVWIAALTSPAMRGVPYLGDPKRVRMLRVSSLLLLGSIFVQLILGATMRHLKAGLAIPDFPLAMGRLIPEFTHYGVGIHYAHRVGALVVVSLTVWLLVTALSRFRAHGSIIRPTVLLTTLLVIQISLGAAVIWMFKAPVPTSMHVLNGAAILGTAVWMSVRAHSVIAPGPLLAGAKESAA